MLALSRNELALNSTRTSTPSAKALEILAEAPQSTVRFYLRFICFASPLSRQPPLIYCARIATPETCRCLMVFTVSRLPAMCTNSGCDLLRINGEKHGHQR